MDLKDFVGDPLTRFFAQVIAVVAVSRILGVVTRWLHQPMVIAEIAAGIVLGPSVLGWILPAVGAAVFAPARGILQLVSEVGLIFFMFLVGLELRPELLRGHNKAFVTVSHANILVPFGAGVLLALHLFPEHAPAGARWWPFALFVGVAMSVSAVPVLARVLSERRLTQTRLGVVAIACATAGDIVAWCLLAFVLAMQRATGLGSATLTTALVVSYVTMMIFVVRPLLARLARRIAGTDGLTQDIVAGCVVLLIVSSWTAALIGIHPLFGAFLFGVMLPKEGGLASALADKLEGLVTIVFLPLFFAYSGLRTHIGLLDSTEELVTCAVVVVIACISKLGATAFAARVAGLPWRESGAVGVLMNARGLMELIVLNVGLDLGLLTPELFTMMVIMALVTTVGTSPALQLLYSNERVTRDLLPQQPSPLADPPGAGILTCVAQGGAGPGLISLASALRHPDREAPIHSLHLLQPSDRVSTYLERTPREMSAGAFGPLLERAGALGVEVRTISFVSTDPAADICGIASSKGAELVLLGCHKPLLSQALLGGTVYSVLRRSTVDVGVFVDRGGHSFKRVLVPFLGSVHDRAALTWAHRLLKSCDAEVTILHVSSSGPGGWTDTAPRVFREPGGQRVVVKLRAHESAVQAALEESNAGYDLVVVGLGSAWGLTERRFSLWPEPLLDNAPVSLLAIGRGGSPDNRQEYPAFAEYAELARS